MISPVMESFEVISGSPYETRRWGSTLSILLRSGDVVALVGELGSGKTTLAQGICEGLDVMDAVTSPSFTLVQEYHGRVPVFHFDFYRLETLTDIEGIDIDSYLMAEGISIIEWAERAYPLLPPDRFTVELRSGESSGEDTGMRILSFRGPVNRGISGLRT